LEVICLAAISVVKILFIRLKLLFGSV